MAISPFVFSSDNLPKLKAKQLFKAFPFLKLSVAQEATARALGYQSWYECNQRGTHGEPSPSDQDAGLPVRVLRYYHQAGVLRGLGISPCDADLWVRAWGLTGHPTLAPELAVPFYYRWNETIARMERGAISEEEAQEGFVDGYSKYEEIDRPQRVCEGLILGPLGRYPHYAVDPMIFARMPAYLRGNGTTFHIEDGHEVLAMTVDAFPKEKRSSIGLYPALTPVQHEWHFGTKHPYSAEPFIPRLIAAALASPEAMVVISMRAMPVSGGDFNFARFAVACLSGKDFAEFLRSKGAIEPDKVVWYRDIDRRELDHINWSLVESYLHKLDTVLPIFEGAERHEPSLPVYSYPFMHGPMSQSEYGMIMEIYSMLALDEDYRGDDGGDDDDEGDDGIDPSGPDFELELLAQQN